MLKLTKKQYWVMVFVTAVIGTNIMMNRLHRKEVEKYLYQAKANHTVEIMEVPPSLTTAPPPEEIPLETANILSLNSDELSKDLSKTRLFIKAIIKEINQQENRINAVLASGNNKAWLSKTFATQKMIDQACKEMELMPKLAKYNGYIEFLAVEKAYEVHHIQYKRGDDLNVINYTNGTRRYYLTLLNRAL